MTEQDIEQPSCKISAAFEIFGDGPRHIALPLSFYVRWAHVK